MKLTYNCTIPNTFGLPVHAACLLEYDSAAELRALLVDGRFSAELPLPLLHIGSGSNLLFTGDFPGTVLHSRIGGIEEMPFHDEKQAVVRVGSGVVWDQFCLWAAQQGYWGPENLAAIPGEVGAAAVQNIGAYGREVKDIVECVECLDLQELTMVTIPGSDCGYGYRESRFKNEWKGRYVVIAVQFRLRKDEWTELDYGHVRQALIARYGGDIGLSPMEVRQVIVDIRAGKLPSPTEIGSAGSFFRNPFILPEQYARIAAIAEKDGLGPVPHFMNEDGTVKVPAAWLIEKCGWKGYRDGNVGVYEKQPLVLINATGRATPDEIVALKDKIIDSVRTRFGVLLRPEVEII